VTQLLDQSHVTICFQALAFKPLLSCPCFHALAFKPLLSCLQAAHSRVVHPYREEAAAAWMGEGEQGSTSRRKCEWGLFLEGLEAKGWDTTSRVLLAADAWRAEWGTETELEDNKTD